MTYREYQEYFETEVSKVKVTPALAEGDAHAKALPLNAHRTRRIEKTYSLSDSLQNVVANIAQKQVWLVLTEPWCGDSAQCLPYISKIAAASPLVEMRILLRDQNVDIMEQYLTRGTRSIPKLISFDQSGNELFRWGPRPREAMELFLKSREAGIPQTTIAEKLHLWYGRNRGKAIEEEFLEILNKCNAGTGGQG
jgi:hypothetical protein